MILFTNGHGDLPLLNPHFGCWPIYNVIEYGNNYSKTSGSLWQYYKEEPDNNLIDSKPFKFQLRSTYNTGDGTVDAEIV